jgi:hypothetical protein
VYAVDAAGATTGTCPIGTPCTIQYAYDTTTTAGSGNTICLESGTYTTAGSQLISLTSANDAYIMMKPGEATNPLIKSTGTSGVTVRQTGAGNAYFDNIDFTMDSANNKNFFKLDTNGGSFYLEDSTITVSATGVQTTVYLFLCFASPLRDLELVDVDINITGHSGPTFAVFAINTMASFSETDTNILVDTSTATSDVDMFFPSTLAVVVGSYTAIDSTVTFLDNPKFGVSTMFGLRDNNKGLSVSSYNISGCSVVSPYGAAIKVQSNVDCAVDIHGNYINLSATSTPSSVGISVGLDDDPAGQAYDGTMDVVMYDNILLGAGVGGLVSAVHGLTCFFPKSAEVYNNYMEGWDYNFVLKGSDTATSFKVYGNFALNAKPDGSKDINMISGIPNCEFYNNTIIQDADHNTDVSSLLRVGSQFGFGSTNAIIKNNLLVGGSTAAQIRVFVDSSIATADKNSYYMTDGTINTDSTVFYVEFDTAKTVAEWQALGYDENSFFENPDVQSYAHPVPLFDSVCIGNGDAVNNVTQFHGLSDFDANTIYTMPYETGNAIGAFGVLCGQM